MGVQADGVTDNHARARVLNEALLSRGWRTWFDEQGDMRGDIDLAMTQGIESTRLVLVCLTEAYMAKIASASLNDNCKKEWNTALNQRGTNGMIVPVVMESFVLRPADAD